MGDLITMSRPIRPSRAVIAASGNADILFFTGVRYSRMPDEMLPDEMLALPTSVKSTKSNKPKKNAAPRIETLQG